MVLVYTEADLKTLKCNICGNAYLRNCDLASHLKKCGKKTIKGPLKCKHCCRFFKARDRLESHEITHQEKRFKCRFCSYCSDRKDSVTGHERIHTKEKPFSCNICDTKFISRNVLEIHIRSHTGDKPFSCNLCLKTFRQTSHLRTHRKSAHPDSNQEKFPCKICQKTYDSKAYLKTHTTTMHSNAKPFQCEVCSKRFRWIGNMQVHTKSHSNIKDYVFCNICSTNFNKAIIKKHKKEVHYDVRIHKCDTCDKRFHRFPDLQRHSETLHGS